MGAASQVGSLQLSLLPSPVTGPECTRVSGSAWPRAQRLLRPDFILDDVCPPCGVINAQGALHPTKMWTGRQCLLTGPRVLPGAPAWNSLDSVWPCGPRCISPTQLAGGAGQPPATWRPARLHRPGPGKRLRPNIDPSQLAPSLSTLARCTANLPLAPANPVTEDATGPLRLGVWE